MTSLPIHRTVTVASSAQVGATGERRLMKVIIGANTASAKAVFYNSADNSGTVLLTVSAIADKGKTVDLSDLGGLTFSTAMYCELSGTAAIAYLWYE